MQYQEVLPISREEAEDALLSSDPSVICDTLVRVTFYDPDWRWVQCMCLQFIQHQDKNICTCAITCLGHLARIHGVLDTEQVMPVLEALLNDPKVNGNVQDALDDIQTFIYEK